MGEELTEREREVLAFLLQADFPGADEARAQADVVQVSQRLGPTVIFELPTDVEAASVVHPVPVETRTRDDRPWEVLLFVKAGKLDSIELVTYEVGEASELPAPDELQEPTIASKN